MNHIPYPIFVQNRNLPVEYTDGSFHITENEGETTGGSGFEP